MRPSEEVEQLVHREGDRRRNRRRAAVSGAVVAVALLVIGVSLTRPGPEVATEVSTASDRTPSPTSGSVRPSVPGSTTAPPEVVTAIPHDDEVDGLTDPPATTGTPTTAMASSRSRPTTADHPTEDPEPISPTTVPALDPPTTTGDPATTTTTTTGSVRMCAADDVEIIEAVLSVPSSPMPWPDDAVPIGHAAVLTYTTRGAPGISPCRTPDGLTQLTITDRAGTEVHRFTLDRGPGRVITEGTWVAFTLSAIWDPSCAPVPPGASYTVTCRPVGLGTYTAHLYDQGVAFPPMTVSVVPDE